MQTFQDDMYNRLKENKTVTTIFLKTGVRIIGQIVAVDKYTVLMNVHGKQQLVYKQAISTIMP
ncbi:RNA chaperone Hfq [Bacillus cereus]|nr:RNA chaperone Hfq [Bacillus cereus]